jgi:hypothetical protein
VTLSSAVSIELSRLEFDVVWQHLGLGAFPTVFRMLGHGRTETERLRLVDLAWQSLRAKGLGRHGDPHPMLAELLTVLSRPEREVDARMNHGESVVRALAGARDEFAAIGVLRAGAFHLSEITPGGLSRAVVALLPEHPAGSGTSVTMPSGLFTAACAASGDDPVRLGAALAERGVREPDAGQLARALSDITGAGQFGAARLDRLGRRMRADHVVGFVDSASGRYLLEARPSAAGEQWTTIAPTDPIRLAGQIDRLLTGLERALDG